MHLSIHVEQGLVSTLELRINVVKHHTLEIDLAVDASGDPS